jgi:methyl-galactoside transport system substrate-binding protein
MKNKIKVFLMLPLLLLSSCSNNKNTINLFIYKEDDTFMQSFTQNIISVLSDTSYNLNVQYASGNQNLQNKQIEEAFTGDIEKDYYIVNPVDRFAASAFVELAKKNYKPIIFINREPLDDTMQMYDECYYVGSNPYLEGSNQATLLNELYGGATEYKNSSYDKNGDGIIQLVLLKGELGHQDAESRSRSFIDTLTSLGYSYEVLETSYCNWDRSIAKESFGKIYSKHNSSDDIELVVSNNDDMALGCIDYIKERGNYNSNKKFIDEYFPIVGVDATNVGCKAVKEGFMYGTVYNDSKEQAKAISWLMDCFVNGYGIDNGPYEFNKNRVLYIPGEIINSKNVDDILV